jgi:hypothetical protein
MKKNIIITLIAVVLIAFIYFYFIAISADKAREIIIKENSHNPEYKNYVNALDDSFVIQWARALRRLSGRFSHNGIFYSTIGGTSL